MKSRKHKQIAGTLKDEKQTKIGQKLDEIPPPGSLFNDFAAQVYLVVCEDLKSRSLLFEADLHLVQGFCNDTAIYNECLNDIKKSGIFYVDKNKQKRRNPALIAMRSAMESANKTAKLLGITPYYRDKVKTDEDEDLFDPVAELMREFPS